MSLFFLNLLEVRNIMSTKTQAAQKPAATTVEVTTTETVSVDSINLLPVEHLASIIAEQSGGKADDPKILAFAKKLQESANNTTTIAEMFETLQKEGLKVTVSLDEKSLEAAGIKVTSTKTDWWGIAKWVGGGFATALIVYGTYRLYVSYSAGKAAKAANANNGTIQL
jgi:hypothetical protein